MPAASAQETRFEIGVTVELNRQPPTGLRLVVFAPDEGQAILTAHAQIEALVGQNRRLRAIRFAS